MNQISKLLLFLVVLFDLVNIWFDLPYRFISKTLFIPSLILYYFSNANKRSLTLLLALFFAWFGDVFLLANDNNSFIAGLSCFLIMQLLYTLLFLRDRALPHPYFYPSVVFLFIFCLAFNFYLAPHTDALFIPVIFYSIAIASMAFAASIRNESTIGYLMILVGVGFFVLSDSILSINKFGPSFWKAGFFVMLTYMLAQYLIVEGYIRYSKRDYL